MSSLELALLAVFTLLASVSLLIFIVSMRANRGRAGGRATQGQEKDSTGQMRVAVHGMLLGMSEQVQDLLGGAEKYGSALKQHQAGIKQAGTRESLAEVEQGILKELLAMREKNDAYRQELEEAKQTIKVQQEEMERLNQDASKDFLTQLANRRTFDARLREEVARFQRHEQLFSVVILDIDHFKRVNDTLGHLAGDRILRAVAALLEDMKRESDFLARYGGEEFVLILPETSLPQAMVVARKMNEGVAKAKLKCDGKRVKVTLSAGVTEVGAEDGAGASVLKRADAALYRAKENGRNRVEATHSTGEEAKLL